MASRSNVIGERVFSVEGIGEFPLDMLRYDSCWPETAVDAAKMTYKDKRVISLRSADRNAPTLARWSSFMWRVV